MSQYLWWGGHQLDIQLGENCLTHWFNVCDPQPHPLTHPSSPEITHVQVVSFDLFLYKKGTIYITFIKSLSIIKYNITRLQKCQIPATIQ